MPRPGPYPVACSNVAQDFARLQPLETADLYWRGVPRDDGAPRYVTELFAEPAARWIDSSVSFQAWSSPSTRGRPNFRW